MSALNDEEIALKVQRGDTSLFGVLVERYEKKMERYAKKFLFGYDDAQDLVQDVFIKAYVNIQSFDTRRKFSPWLYRIAHNEFINAIKRRGREHLTFFDPDTVLPHLVHEESPHDEDIEYTRKILDECLDKLDPKYREPLVLYYYEEVGYHEIAEILQIPTSTVGVRLRRGKQALRKVFDESHPHYEQ